MNSVISIMKEDKELIDIVNNIKKLNEQIQHPDRNGMISAISDATRNAPVEVAVAEFARGNTTYVPWDYFNDEELYNKLGMCMDSLRAHGIAKVGEKAFNELLKSV